MGYRDKMREYSQGNLSFLSEDGEVLLFMVVGDPVLIEGKYKGKESKRIAIPIVTEEGLSVFITGMRLARRIGKHESDFTTKVFRVERHGSEGDAATSYSLQILEDTVLASILSKISKDEVTIAGIEEEIEAARKLIESQ